MDSMDILHLLTIGEVAERSLKASVVFRGNRCRGMPHAAEANRPMSICKVNERTAPTTLYDNWARKLWDKNKRTRGNISGPFIEQARPA